MLKHLFTSFVPSSVSINFGFRLEKVIEFPNEETIIRRYIFSNEIVQPNLLKL